MSSLLDYMLGKSKPAAAGPAPGVPAQSATVQAQTDMTERVEQLTKKVEFDRKQALKLRMEAKALLERKKKTEALRLLKKAKLMDNQTANYERQADNLTMQLQALDIAEQNNATVNAQRSFGQAMANTMDTEAAEAVVEEVEDAMERVNEINDVLGREMNYGGIGGHVPDDEDLLNEFMNDTDVFGVDVPDAADGLPSVPSDGIDLAGLPAVPTADVSLPDVPAAAPAAPAAAAPAASEEADLLAWAAN